jgi:hypothetical protein
METLVKGQSKAAKHKETEETEKKAMLGMDET